jgi:hypothetical protein
MPIAKPIDSVGTIGTTPRQSWLFYLPLARQASLLKDDLLEAGGPVDGRSASWNWYGRAWQAGVRARPATGRLFA